MPNIDTLSSLLTTMLLVAVASFAWQNGNRMVGWVQGKVQWLFSRCLEWLKTKLRRKRPAVVDLDAMIRRARQAEHDETKSRA